MIALVAYCSSGVVMSKTKNGFESAVLGSFYEEING